MPPQPQQQGSRVPVGVGEFAMVKLPDGGYGYVRVDRPQQGVGQADERRTNTVLWALGATVLAVGGLWWWTRRKRLREEMRDEGIDPDEDPARRVTRRAVADVGRMLDRIQRREAAYDDEEDDE